MAHDDGPSSHGGNERSVEEALFDVLRNGDQGEDTPAGDSCWKLDRGHIPDPEDPELSICKDPTDMETHLRIRWLISAETPPEEQRELHVKDIFSTWFGVVQSNFALTKPSLFVWPRLSWIIENQFACLRNEKQYPSLVSFIGDTGGGKSTVIKTLIRNHSFSESWEVPVPGNPMDSHLSTSGDVHLYADPSSLAGTAPIFYADCEGLRGGSPASVSALFYDPKYPPQPGQPHIQEGFQDHSRQISRDHKEMATHRLILEWAPGLSMGDRSWRPTVVKNLYPRFLYTFSDVVCYVTDNAKKLENEMKHLLEWATLGHQKTINQHIKPGLIIVINKDNRSNAEEWCDVDLATRLQMTKLNQSDYFYGMQKQWNEQGKAIKTTKDLILCYYDSFRVICIPSLEISPTRVIAEQYEKLHAEIQLTSRTIIEKRERRGMRLDIESFVLYTQYAFELLAKSLGKAFDFHYVAGKVPSIPEGFTDHLINLLAKLRQRQEDISSETTVGQERNMLENFTPYLATCLASEYIEKREGRMDEFLDTYAQTFRHALELFHRKHWRCEAIDSGRQCLNFLDGHDKGHQYSPDSLPRAGEFVGHFESQSLVRTLSEHIRKGLQSEDINKLLLNTGRLSGVSKIKSNRTCLTCLSRCPVHPLRCQHCLCDVCALRFNTNNNKREKHVLVIPSCPLGCATLPDAWRIRLKPASAGVRVLSLDGGGIRGILELCALKSVEDAVGLEIPIKELFDVVIGTSTGRINTIWIIWRNLNLTIPGGGIIALGLFKCHWSIDKAIEIFESLVSKAFSARLGLGLPIFSNVAQIMYSHRYKSGDIESALQEAFGSTSPLFGQPSSIQPDNVKVGVISISNEEGRPYLLANYTRDLALPSLKDEYLRREENQDDELKTWEAARCTSAAQTFFEPYYHKSTHRSYSDGGLRHNNPVQIAERERRHIWPESDHKNPDIVLSIGTGIQATEIKPKDKANTILHRFVPRGLMGMIAVGIQSVSSTLDCQQEWERFRGSIDHEPELLERCHRLNVALADEPPRLDDVSKIPALKSEAANFLAARTTREEVQRISRQLIASLFYFVLLERQDIEGGVGHRLSGLLRCRLSPAMTKQFLNLTLRGPIFRVVQGQGRDRRDTDLVGRHTPTVQFDMKTFSSEVDINVADSSGRISIEIAFLDQTDCFWNAISGFPCAMGVGSDGPPFSVLLP